MLLRELALIILLFAAWPVPGYGEDLGAEQKGPKMIESKTIFIQPIGQVKKQGENKVLEILPRYAPGLKGLEGFSHLWVFYWFHENDNPEARAVLQVHPRRDPANPLTGVFACRAPERPNLIGLTPCRIVSIKGNVVEVAGLDAREGTPIVDLKPYLPKGDSIPEATAPEWVKRSRPPGAD
jgi:tRNA-Thr(GGU) m(6)t(6)A37 methyltransferase TsaA